MTVQEVKQILEENKNERGIAVWERTAPTTRLKSYGIGLTQLKKIAKEIGKDHELAQKLWKEDFLDCVLLSIMLEEPKKVTREQVEEQKEHLNYWMLAHTYCSVLLAKVTFIKELADQWTASSDTTEKRCGYLVLYEIAKSNKKLTDDYFIPYLETIEAELQSQENFVKDAMNNCIWMIGSRNKVLHEIALRVGQVFFCV